MNDRCPSTLALERFALGELSPGEAEAVSVHLTECAACRERLKGFAEQRLGNTVQAKSALARVDRKWQRNAVLVALAGSLALAAGAGAVFAPKPALEIAAVKTPAASASGRRVVEPSKSPGRGMPTRSVWLRTEQVDVGQGTMAGIVEGEDRSRNFELLQTTVEAEVTGFVSHVTVTQRFRNPLTKAAEAVYVFPLPDDAAVDEMTLVAGTRRIRAEIHKRDEARQIYEQAKSEGRRAALLDQQRPNVFTQSVANLLPGETVEVTLHYVAPVHYDDGQYTFMFPMVVKERFDAPAGMVTERTSRDISIHVRLMGSAGIESVWPGSHNMVVEGDKGVLDVTLSPADRVPNRDFVLHWQVAGASTQANVFSTGGPGGTFALMVTPELKVDASEVTAKEMVFVIDTSGSMSGAPLEAAKRAMTQAMEQMNPNDTFMLIDFADKASTFHSVPLPNTRENVERALAYLVRLPDGGGTNQLAGIRAALDRPEDPERLRIVLLMTDGFIGNEREVFAETMKVLGKARLFSFGIGESVNHYLLSRLADVGRGFAQDIPVNEDPGFAIERFVRRISRPVLTDISIDWGTLEMFEVLPKVIPDLFDAQPLVVMGRNRGVGRSVITIRGMQAGKPVELKVPIDLPEQRGQATGLGTLWARAQIEALSREQYFGERVEVVQEITTLGLEHHLVTAYTSLVAVDNERVAAAGPDEGPYVESGERQRPRNARQEKIQIIRSGHDDESFDSAFGPAKAKPKPTSSYADPSVCDVAPKKAAFIPPAPGVAGELADSLTTSEVMEVVLAHKAELAVCMQAQRREHPGVSGKIVVRWTVLKSGHVTRLETVTPGFAKTPLALCLIEEIKTWVFPKHAKQGEPIQFPFRF